MIHENFFYSSTISTHHSLVLIQAGVRGSLYWASVISQVREIFSCVSAIRNSHFFLFAFISVAKPENDHTAIFFAGVSEIVILELFGTGNVSLVRLLGMTNETSVISPFGVEVTGAVISIFSLVCICLLVTGAVISMDVRDTLSPKINHAN